MINSNHELSLCLRIAAVLSALLLINLVFASSYLVSAASKDWWESSQNRTYEVKSEFRASYSVNNSVWSCCPQTPDGAVCQNQNPAFANCATDLLPASCEHVAGCQTGCCIDAEEGLCSPNSPQAECEAAGGVWREDASCNLNECQKGCCVLGSEVSFVTAQRCERLSLALGFEQDFRSIESELGCLVLEKSQVTGACIFESGICKFGTESECQNCGGVFSQGNLCSNPELNTACERQASVGCYEAQDEIYWFDSCGNRENIYSSDKEASWNNGMVQGKKESCNPESANINSEDCGNCNYFLGSKCSESGTWDTRIRDGGFICEDLNCVDDTGTVRKNGESWCVYDSFIGDGKDPAGSRHWKRMCIDGEIEVEQCADYRGQICVQSQITADDHKFTTAQCVVNEAVKCLTLDLGECQKNSACMIKSVNVDSGFRFDVCVGKYPRGFDLSKESQESSSELCRMANTECKVIYVKDWKGRWKCKQNCNCETSAFADQMNDLCINLGDCGSYINHLGEGSDNIGVTNSPAVSWESYRQYAQPLEGQYAEPKSVESTMSQLAGSPASFSPDNTLESAAHLLQVVSGATGTIASATAIGIFTAQTGSIGNLVYVAKGALTGTQLGTGMAATLQAVGTVAAAAGIGMLIGAVGSWAFGVKGEAATLAQIVGAVVGGGVAAYLSFAGTGSAAGSGAAAGSIGTAGAGAASGGASGFLTLGGAFGPWMAAAFWAAVAVVAILGYAKLIGWGDTKEVIVKFNCYPWQAPFGGDDCERCNDDPLRPCSEYRCNSLGAACLFINDDTENPACAKIEDDRKVPMISPKDVMEGYQFSNQQKDSVQIERSDAGCIPEFTHVALVLGTDEYAQCRLDYDPGKDFESMAGGFAEQTSYSRNHTLGIFMPSMESFGVSGLVNLTDVYKDFGVYIKCRDVYGDVSPHDYRLSFCLSSGPDVTAPRILISNLQNQSYIRYDQTEFSGLFYVNEPSQCRWALTDSSFEDMKGFMDCDTDLLSYKVFGWECRADIKGMAEEENTVYVRCKDQPWLSVENQSRNTNQQSFAYTLAKVKDNLEISSISPSGVYKGNFEPVTVKLEVRTSKGADNGKAICSYGLSENESMRFFTTGADRHYQTFNTLMSGNYRVYVSCVDAAANTANGQTAFEVFIDTEPPQVIRTYKEGESLFIATNEAAECYYSLGSCTFSLNDGESMSPTMREDHSADWLQGKTYHIKCSDLFGNTNDGCAIIVKAS